MAQDEVLKTLAGGGLTVTRRLRIEDWGDWWDAVTRAATLGELALIVACGLLAWGLTVLLRRRARALPARPGILLGRRGVDGVLFPLMWLTLGWLGWLAWLRWQGAAPLLRVALPVLLALAVIVGLIMLMMWPYLGL